jgi:hypothetical protein
MSAKSKIIPIRWLFEYCKNVAQMELDCRIRYKSKTEVLLPRIKSFNLSQKAKVK